MKNCDYRLVYNRKGRKLKPDELAVIQVEIYYNRKRKYISTGIKVKRDQWQQGKQRIVNHPNQIKLNRELSRKLKALQDYELSVIESGRRFTLDHFDDLIIEDQRDGVQLGDFIREHFVGNPAYARGTIRHYESLISILDDFGGFHTLSDFTYQNILAFDVWAHKRVASQHTIYGYHKRLKAIIRKAVALRLIRPDDNPYLRFKAQRGKSRPKFLDEKELAQIEEKEIRIERLARVRDMFVFCCYTGLAYTELSRLTADHIVQRGERLWIEIERQKTGTLERVPLFPQAVAIIDRYRGIRAGRLFPVLSNQKMNAYLKEIGDICGVHKELTTHVARHTFATTVMLKNGVSLEVVSEVLGHTNLRTTQIYAKMIADRVEREVHQVEKHLSNRQNP